MFSYPLVFNNENEHVAHIEQNLDFYKGFIDNLPQIKRIKTDKDE